jgi:L-arabinose isomerase
MGSQYYEGGLQDMKNSNVEFWFITGSQHLYGPEVLRQVEKHSSVIAEELGKDKKVGAKIVFKPVVKTPDEIRDVCIEANATKNCAGIIAWMHTFSPAKMWIAGLMELKKPILHLHTQFNRDIPWAEIDMDFMNLNQSAHGDREFGFIASRLRIDRKVAVGYWEDAEVRQEIGSWVRSATAYIEGRNLKIARFGDNMREVAVTEGDKVEAQIKFGWSINGYGVGDLVKVINQVSQADVSALMQEYEALYDIAEEAREDGPARDSILEQARIELGMEAFLIAGDFKAFTTTFEDLHGMKQLPGLAVQRLMAKGYGFGAEGDWKTSALVRLMKIMAGNEGTSFMEDYTYHFEPGNELVLGAHMLEICPTVASMKPKLEVHPLGIGGKANPARLVFDGRVGPALNASLIDLGNRFRLILNQVDVAKNENPMPRLPVANVLWRPQPSLKKGAEAWILAGGAHHTGFSYVVTPQQLIDWAAMVGVECLLINNETDIRAFKNEMRWNELFWGLRF